MSFVAHTQRRFIVVLGHKKYRVYRWIVIHHIEKWRQYIARINIIIPTTNPAVSCLYTVQCPVKLLAGHGWLGIFSLLLLLYDGRPLVVSPGLGSTCFGDQVRHGIIIVNLVQEVIRPMDGQRDSQIRSGSLIQQSKHVQVPA